MRRWIAIVIGTLACICFAWFYFAAQPADAQSRENRYFVIKKGQSLSVIADHLEQEHLIRSALLFRVYARMTGAQSKLQAGSYMLRPSQSPSDIITVMMSGKVDDVSITIPEGYTVAQIDALLADKGFGKPGDIIDCAMRCDFSPFDFLPESGLPTATQNGVGTRLEGYMFPDTYELSQAQYVPKFAIERMLTNFKKRVTLPLKSDIAGSGKSLHEIMTMASLVEEESRLDSERPVVSGILYNRLKQNMLLGVDATIRYGLGKKAGQPLTREDLEIDNAYNTRRKLGPPPTPIANPGLSSIEAAIHPQPTDYLYYLHDAKGKIHYARTNDEHNANRNRYLR